MSQALAGMRVMVPVTEGRTDLAAAVVAAGATAIEVEFIAIVPAADRTALEGAVREWCAGAYDWMAVTSRNAVLAMDASARSLGLSLAAPAALGESGMLAAVGDATGAVCESIGMRVDLVPTTANAKGLVADFPEGEGRVLVPLGDNASGALAAGLARKGWDVTTVEAYRTVEGEGPTAAQAEALASGAVDAVLLTSGAVAARLAAACPNISESTTMVAIGPTTAAAAAHAGLRVDAVAEAPTYESLIAALSRTTGRTIAMTGTNPQAAGPHRPDRPRRLRSTAPMRALVRETSPRATQLVLPLFIKEGIDAPHPIASLPGVSQLPLGALGAAVREAADAGIGGVMLFAIPATRDAVGSAAYEPEGILNRSIREAVAAAGERIVVMADLCLDEFTDHGHCGLLDGDGRVDNDATLAAYARMAVAQARAGAHVLGLSGMMDGQVAAVRAALDAEGFVDAALLAYAAKYASAFYGPFRDAVDSALVGDRKTYQMDPANRREALREAALDEAEGADIVMVKPALPYLDVLSDVAASALVPVAAYHVSGEYAQIEAAAANGWIDRRAAHFEALTSIVRAGASIVVTYAALDLAAWLRERS